MMATMEMELRAPYAGDAIAVPLPLMLASVVASQIQYHVAVAKVILGMVLFVQNAKRAISMLSKHKHALKEDQMILQRVLVMQDILVPD